MRSNPAIVTPYAKAAQAHEQAADRKAFWLMVTWCVGLAVLAFGFFGWLLTDSGQAWMRAFDGVSR